MRVLTGTASGRLSELTVALGGALLEQAGVDDAHAKVKASIANGTAAEKFGAMVYAMGGPVHFVEDWVRFLPEAPVIREVTAATSGTVTAIDGEALGLTVVALGGGRQVESDVVNPAVGLSDVVSVGDRVTKGQPLARVHAARESQADEAEQALRAAITLTDGPATAPPLVLEHIT